MNTIVKKGNIIVITGDSSGNTVGTITKVVTDPVKKQSIIKLEPNTGGHSDFATMSIGDCLTLDINPEHRPRHKRFYKKPATWTKKPEIIAIWKECYYKIASVAEKAAYHAGIRHISEI